MKKVVVVGAGPAGMMAACEAAQRGLQVTLLEKNERPGKKLLISGKGRCNITNNTDIDGLIRNIPGNGNFLYSTFHAFSNADLLQFLAQIGLETKVERGGRVFPVSDRASDVVEALMAHVCGSGVQVLPQSRVTGIDVEDGAVRAVRLKNGDRRVCDSVVVATGGASYPGTGSSGDGYKMVGTLGHTIRELKPSLIPLLAEEAWVRDLQGLSLKNIAIRLTDSSEKTVYEDFGEMLFTHYGVSGPVILSGSRHILDYGYRDIKLHIDLKPALSEDVLDQRLQRDFAKYTRKQFQNALDDLLPRLMIPVFVRLSGIPGGKCINQITRDERKALVKLLKDLTMTICGSRPIEEAIVTAGGVATGEISPKTMESRRIKGLFLAGEIIDVDGYTGGFNLTIAFSTGVTAGRHC